MRLNDIQHTHARPKSKRLGRGNGSGKGTYAGRGVKGQKARSGGKNKIPHTFIGGSTSMVQRLPKLKGFKSRAIKPVTVSLARIASRYEATEVVTLVSLIEKGIINDTEALRGIKIVGSEGITTKFTFEQGNDKLKTSKALLA
jgi:large subunit ribosomal protein L15